MANTNVMTGTVRLSFLNVFKPRASVEGADAKYSACILIPKTDTKTVQAIKELAKPPVLALPPSLTARFPKS